MDARSLAARVAELNDDGLRHLLVYLDALRAVPRYQRPAAPSRTLRLLPHIDKPRLALELPSGAYFVCTVGGAVTFPSPDLVRWLDCTPAMLTGEGWFSFVDGDEERRRIGGYWLAAAQAGHPFCYTVRCKTVTGAIKYAFVRVKPCLHPTAGTVEGFLGTVHPQVLPVHVEHAAGMAG